MLTIASKINYNTNNLNPLKSNVQPSFGSILPKKEIFEQTKMLVKDAKDVFETQQIEQLSGKYIEKINSLIPKNSPNLSSNEKNIIRGFQDDWINQIATKLQLTIITEENLIQQKNAIKQFVKDIKECMKKWTKVEDYVNNPNKKPPAPDGFESFKNFELKP